MKKLIIGLLAALAMGSSMALDLDLSDNPDIASGEFDLDTQYNGVSSFGNGNVAGIYQINNEDADLVNKAEIQQVDGVNNLAMIWQSGFSHEARIFQTEGENNIARLLQIGSGHYAHLTQIGGIDNIMTVTMLGESAIINATQTDAVSNVLIVVLNSGSNLNITQSGEGNNFTAVMASNTSMVVRQTGQ
jgi:hypothetical protein